MSVRVLLAAPKPGEPAERPLLAETRALFEAVNSLDLDALRALVHDDFGIVDVDPAGRTVVLDDVPAWDGYMTTQMDLMRAARAALATEVLDYQAVAADGMGYSVVRFRQHVTLPGQDPLTHHCVATVVWRHGPDGRWREARWHCSRLPEPAAG